MSTVPIISIDKDLIKNLPLCVKHLKQNYQIEFFRHTEAFLEYLRYNLPEFSIIHLTKRIIDTYHLLKDIENDPWLHYGGIILIHDEVEEKDLAPLLYNKNIMGILHKKEIEEKIPRILRIIHQNRQILFQRGIQMDLIQNLSSTYTIDNDPFDVKIYANLISNFLYNSNLINLDNKDRLNIALFELLFNAIEHGNCQISFEEKTQWLQTNGDILKLIAQINKDKKIQKKKIYFSYKITPERSYFTIRDEGNGFQWKKVLKDKKTNFSMHGHGIRMSSHFTQNLKYNAKGNEVSFYFEHQKNESNIVPEIFADQKEIHFKKGQTVCREGDEASFLYYVVSGSFLVMVNNKIVSTITPEDLFIGEMSFLLNNRRSATIVSGGKSTLICISKESFINAIKNNPHYGIFLARLLAQRLTKMNQLVSKTDSKKFIKG